MVSQPTTDVYVTRVGHVATIWLNRPDCRNAINRQLSDQLVEAVGVLDGDADTRAMVLTGFGRGFSSGMDLAEYTEVGVPASLTAFFEAGSKKPMIAAVEGFALAGGLELALRCDLIVAARDSVVGFPEAKVGLVAWYGAARLQRMVSRQTAAELLLTGAPIAAERLYESGMFSRLVDKGCAVSAAQDLATRIAMNAPLSVDASKSLLDLAWGRSDQEYIDQFAAIADIVYASADSREGARAFLEKRPPVWESA